MMKQVLRPGVALAVMIALAGCSGSPQTPLSPSSGVGGSWAAAADGSTLKVTAPVLVAPENGARTDTRRPTLSWQNSTGKYAGIGVAYEIEIVQVSSGAVVYTTIVGEGAGISEHVIPVDGAYDTEYRWRVRARLETSVGPWSTAFTFRTLVQPVAGGGAPGGTGTVGPQRAIQVNEAFGIIVRIHNEGRYDLGSNSSRDYRVNFLFGAVAAIHYGHPRWNAAGPDPSWCVKDAGGGRPPSDDVLVLCQARDAWDLIGGAGANGYTFHLDYLGRLPGEQNVYPPGTNYLNGLPQ
jgi:hypothetical protein